MSEHTSEMTEESSEISEKNYTETLRIQLEELETLEAMFCNPGEIRIEDPLTVIEIKEYIEDSSKSIPPCLDFEINLVVDEIKFEFCASLPKDYPNVEPEVFIRNNLLSRNQHIQLNKKVGEIIKDMPRGEPCIFSVICWLQENALSYIERPSENCTERKVEKKDEIVRYWIYSHHIYSKTKRKEIVDLANHLKLTGFSMPGRPGIVCIEGYLCDCNEWWQVIKSMNWKKIFCKVTEENLEKLKHEDFFKFQKFEEIVFTYHGHGERIKHMDMGQLLKYLEDHRVGYIFKELFGVENSNK